MRIHIATAALVGVFSLIILVSSTEAQLRQRARVGGQANQVVSQNFVVRAEDPILARKVSQEAERFRKELAIEWLGKELPNWSQKCPITVELGMHAGGETSFAFMPDKTGRGRPMDWQMKIFGPHDRILDAVLPHEVTHTIFATHFGRPLPRWADEGACTTVEHVSERKKNHAMLMDFLNAQPSRGLPFNRMFTMRNYPHDILPLYAQGYSVAKFLILQKGKRYFLDYIGSGLKNERRGQELRAWDQVTSEFYDYDNLSELQLAWLEWVRNGSSETAFNQSVTGSDDAIAQAISPQINGNHRSTLTSSAPSQWRDASKESTPIATTFTRNTSDSWYAQQMYRGSEDRVATNRLEPAQTKTRRVTPATRPVVPATSHDSRLPAEFRAIPQTIWR